MDKKNSSRSSSAPKGNASTDAKSKQDGSGKQQQQQQWPGSSGSGGSGGRRGRWAGGGQQWEGGSRRPAPQRNRTTPDKRPQPKGQPPPAAQASSQGQRSQVARNLQDDSVEEALRKGNRKVNLNHLLKFTLTPRESDHHHHHNYWPGHRSGRPPAAKHSKEQFLQANCQFVVREGTVRRWDPDVPVAWELVHEVRVLHEQERCPVCLGAPRAAQMPPCGHVHCWSCLLHYLALSDRPYRPCPICYRPFSAQQLRRVVPQERRGYRPGDEITMCLMRRQKNQPGAQPAPADLWRLDLLEPFNVDQEERLTCHQRVLVACPRQLGTMLDREESELRAQLLEEGDAPEACFVQAALQASGGPQALQQRRQDLEKEVGPLDVNANSQQPQLLETVDADGNLQGLPTRNEHEDVSKTANDDDDARDTLPDMAPGGLPSGSYQARSRERRISSGSSGGEDGAVGAEDLEMPIATVATINNNTVGREATTVQGGDSFYYFQAADGQPVFLHALNARMLVCDYKALELAPPTFTARIVEIEGASIDNELRRKLRYLRHLPLTCEIQVVEVQLEPPLVTQATLDHFAPDMEKRRRQRSRRARNEKRQDRLRAQEEMRRHGFGGGARYQLDSVRHFPTCESGKPSPPSPPPPSEPSSVCSEGSIQTVGDLEEEQQPQRGSSGSSLAEEAAATAGGSGNRVSFAQMLQTRSAGTPGATASRLQRGPPVRGAPSSTRGAATGSDADDDEEGCPVPLFRHSFSLALEEALNAAAAASAAAHADGTTRSPDGSKGKPGSKKNKKKNMTLLFATSMNRSK
ncbi:hypothetical protein V5799_013960 [Amblyomma americanum]|uniref:E3 ubiquitin-protein ligase RNF10 n=1 Tax=Amblyomma americanum TaxID=6943 RepID=A0AAQ4E4E5_AMBAM